MDAQSIKLWNDAHHGTSLILTSGSKTHFMTSQTLLQVYEQLISPAVQLQRAKHFVLSC